ncbi:MAG: hypothetical protein LUE13_01590 [Akkermansiaceae bacterium]|nr:hypothetical protein [Akkermansiaceae bacterium]
MMKTLLCCLGMFVLFTQSQAFASKVEHCRYEMVNPTTATQELKDYKPHAYKVLITFTVQYQHAGDDESIARSKTYSKEYTIAAKTDKKAEEEAVKIAHTFAQEELEKQCKEKKCEDSNK